MVKQMRRDTGRPAAPPTRAVVVQPRPAKVNGHSPGDRSRHAKPPGSRRGPSRGLLFALLTAACLALAAGYVGWAILGPQTRVRTGPAGAASTTLTQPTIPVGDRPQLLLRTASNDDLHGRIALLPLAASDGERAIAALQCDRVHYAAGQGLCLAAKRAAVGTKYSAYLFGPDLRLRQPAVVDGIGIPSRARVSPDGRYAAFTVFVNGHSYASGSFSTRTLLVNAANGAELGDLEEFAVWRDGARFQAPDFNFWGVTFAQDSNRFYATLGTGGKTYLVEGDVAGRQARVLREGVECPSLSPDNTRLVFKKQVGSGGRSLWQLHLLDLATMTETALAETRNVDDQVEWLDNDQVIYGLPDEAQSGVATTSLWVVPANGQGEARLFVAQASSPAVIR